MYSHYTAILNGTGQPHSTSTSHNQKEKLHIIRKWNWYFLTSYFVFRIWAVNSCCFMTQLSRFLLHLTTHNKAQGTNITINYW